MHFNAFLTHSQELFFACYRVVPRVWVKYEIWHVLLMMACLFVHVDITLFSLSLLFVSCCLIFIYSPLGCCCVFVSFLVVSGKLKCHPSPIHRPDRDRKLSQPPSILLTSPLHHPISTHVSVVTGNSGKRTLMGKKKKKKSTLSLGLQGKAAPFHSIIFPFYALPNPILFMDKLFLYFKWQFSDCFSYVLYSHCVKKDENVCRVVSFEGISTALLILKA